MKSFIPLLLILFVSCSQKQPVRNDNNDKPIKVEKLVKQFKKIIGNNDKEKLSRQILYPLNREHPLPEVVDKEDFLKRYDEIFDIDFRNVILNSKQEEWETVGSRGLMFDNGSLWLDFSGRVFAVNYQSKAEKQKATILLDRQATEIHESLKHFEKPVLELETARFKVRIDDMGDYHYRYASWSEESLTTEEPDLVLTGGEIQYQGSGGDYLFEFKNGEYRYVVMTNKMGPNGSAPAMLKIYYRDKETLTNDAIKFKD